LNAAGDATRPEVAEAERNLASQRAFQPELVQQRVETRNALNLLLNGTRWPEASEQTTIPPGPTPPAAGLPASLLGSRLDLRAAEMRLRETLAQTDATRLSFYPNLSLTASLDIASTGLSELVSNPLGSLAATLSAPPFIPINEAHFATQLARTQYDKAVVIVFRKTLLQALIDVDNVLSARTQLETEAVHLDRPLEAAKTAENLYAIRYALAARLCIFGWAPRRRAANPRSHSRTIGRVGCRISSLSARHWVGRQMF
jgi:outer membrane protein TolC